MVQGAGFRVQGAGFRVQGAGCRVQGAGFRVQGAGFRVQGAGFRVQGAVWGVGYLRGLVGGALVRVLEALPLRLRPSCRFTRDTFNLNNFRSLCGFPALVKFSSGLNHL